MCIYDIHICMVLYVYVPTNIIIVSPCSYDDDKSDDECAFVRALRMSGGDGANSYSANSLLQVFQSLHDYQIVKLKTLTN